jgi:hypothetical protein
VYAGRDNGNKESHCHQRHKTHVPRRTAQRQTLRSCCSSPSDGCVHCHENLLDEPKVVQCGACVKGTGSNLSVGSIWVMNCVSLSRNQKCVILHVTCSSVELELKRDYDLYVFQTLNRHETLSSLAESLVVLIHPTIDLNVAAVRCSTPAIRDSSSTHRYNLTPFVVRHHQRKVHPTVCRGGNPLAD